MATISSLTVHGAGALRLTGFNRANGLQVNLRVGEIQAPGTTEITLFMSSEEEFNRIVYSVARTPDCMDYSQMSAAA